MDAALPTLYHLAAAQGQEIEGRIAETSPRMTVETIGYSHERRPILFIVVTSEENHARLDEIQGAHIRLTEPASGAAPEAAMPVVAWHGGFGLGTRSRHGPDIRDKGPTGRSFRLIRCNIE